MISNDQADDLTEEVSGGFFRPAYDENLSHVWDDAEGAITVLTIIGAALAIWQFIVLVNQFRKGDPAKRIVLPLIGGLLFSTALIMPQVMIPFCLSVIDTVIAFVVSIFTGWS